MMAEFHLAASISGSLHCACELAVTLSVLPWALEQTTVIVNTCAFAPVTGQSVLREKNPLSKVRVFYCLRSHFLLCCAFGHKLHSLLRANKPNPVAQEAPQQETKFPWTPDSLPIHPSWPSPPFYHGLFCFLPLSSPCVCPVSGRARMVLLLCVINAVVLSPQGNPTLLS